MGQRGKNLSLSGTYKNECTSVKSQKRKINYMLKRDSFLATL